VRREDEGRALRDVLDGVHEDRTTLRELAHDMRVVDDLLPHVHRLSVHLKRTFDRVDGPLDAGAVAPGRGEDDPLHQTAARIARFA
jgi:hypothetical protein